MTRQLVVPNAALLKTRKTHKPSFLYISHPSVEPPVLRDLECFLELRNQSE